jgi:hypothetical protein
MRWRLRSYWIDIGLFSAASIGVGCLIAEILADASMPPSR